ncbi:UNVERIFIED_CONTAM: HMG (high mobility group) box domain-containing protein [Hammondia hammondi]|eukprot:XP_008889455.1 HMG (high mobility group) box domain-containing protein [Hammondia hammondi]
MAPKKVTKKGAEGKKKRTKKDPNAPKKPLSSYMFFAKDKRAEILKKQPSLKSDIGKVGKMIGEEWAKLSSSQKMTYQKKAEQEKIRYQREMSLYNKKK